MGFTKNELATDRRRKVTSDIDGFAPFFLSVREWQLAPPPPTTFPPHTSTLFLTTRGLMRGELGLEENRPEMAEGFFNYLRGLLVTKTLCFVFS